MRSLSKIGRRSAPSPCVGYRGSTGDWFLSSQSSGVGARLLPVRKGKSRHILPTKSCLTPLIRYPCSLPASVTFTLNDRSLSAKYACSYAALAIVLKMFNSILLTKIEVSADNTRRVSMGWVKQVEFLFRKRVVRQQGPQGSTRELALRYE